MIDNSIFENKKAAYYTLGCKLNFAETSTIGRILSEQGIRKARQGEIADICVINTCSVTELADKKCRQAIRRIGKENPGAYIVVTGCYAQLKPEEVSQIEGVDLVLGAEHKLDILSYLDGLNKNEKAGTVITSASKDIRKFTPSCSADDRTRHFLKVQDGCDYFCSYCTIPFARGRVRSRNSEDVIREVKRLAEHGFREIVLTGIHLSSYGVDTGDDLLHLIREVHNVEGIERIRLGSLEPRIVTDGFAAALAGLPKICPHFHLSLQSGCDATLQRMNRRYDTREYEEGCQILRKYFDHPAITTDVIVGFPGETEEEFAVTKEYLKRIHFYEMHIFQYSKREGTKAAVMEHQVPEPVKKERSNILLALEKKMSEEFREYYVGKQVTALMEEAYEFEGETYFTGYTKEYVKIAVKSAADLSNQFVKGTIRGRLTDDIYLMVEF